MRRWDLLVHPVFTGATAVLAVNDHVLKVVAPGVMSGKVSDFAGVFVVAILIYVVTRMPFASVAITAIGFSALKLSADVATFTAPILGGTTRQDPSDLIALVVLWAAYLFVRPVRSPTPSLSLRPLVVAASGIAVILSVTATSCEAKPGVATFAVDGERVFARIDESGDERWVVSRDGGRTWSRSADLIAQPASPPTRACTEDVCYRVITGERVEEEPTGTEWKTSFAFTEEQERRIGLRTTRCLNDVKTFGAVTVVEVDGSSHIVVAMGSQGVLHRRGTGGWERLAVGDVEPSALFGPSWLSKLLVGAFVLVLLSPIFLIWGSRRRRSGRPVTAFLVSLVGGFGLIMFAGLLGLFAVDYAVMGPVIAFLCVVVFGASVIVFRADDAPPPPSTPDE